jgi:Ni/Fe-hydrogenase subunit HybB-like protein
MAITLGDIRLRRYPIGPGIVLIWLMGAFGLGVTVWRWIAGLGATTYLSDNRGWGLWISYDVIAGVGLAAGAFTVAAAVYIFNLKKLYPLVRPVILTGFISYGLAALSIMVDLGFPQRIWHLIIYWNVHSPLFEIGWCVMLYLTVLLLEFSPVVFEALHWNVPLKFIRAITIPLIIAGIVLSTMHQSTLGTLLTINPYRIHPLFYTPFFPLYFYMTAIAAGIAMTIFESYHSARTYGYKYHFKATTALAKAVPYILGLYIVFKFAELAFTGKYIYLMQGGWPAIMYVFEVLGGVIIPTIMFADPKVRNRPELLVWASALVMGGLIINRFNASLVFLNGTFYLPSWQEIAVSLGLTCLGIIGFDAAVRFLPMFPEPTTEAVKQL